MDFTSAFNTVNICLLLIAYRDYKLVQLLFYGLRTIKKIDPNMSECMF